MEVRLYCTARVWDQCHAGKWRWHRIKFWWCVSAFMFPSVLRSPTFSWAPTRHPFLPVFLSWERLLDRHHPLTAFLMRLQQSVDESTKSQMHPSSPLSGGEGGVEMWHGFQVFTFSACWHNNAVLSLSHSHLWLFVALTNETTGCW